MKAGVAVRYSKDSFEYTAVDIRKSERKSPERQAVEAKK
jgi:disulfide oxidoreductase YuzD